MCQHIEQILSKPNDPKRIGILLLDGHLVLNYKPISNICKGKYFITLDKETVHSRRIHRNYIPPDPIGYYDQWVWPMYLANKKELESCYHDGAISKCYLQCYFNLINRHFYNDTAYIEGSQSIDAIFDLVYNKLLNDLS